MEERVKISVDSNGVADVALVRGQKMNALDAAMFDAIIAAAERLAQEPGLRAVVLHGEGQAFCAGLDMGRFAGMAGGVQNDPLRLERRSHGISNGPQQVAMGWRQVPVPVIAAVHGVAFGGGLQLALGADIRLLAPGTQMSVMEIKWGLVPDMSAMVLLRGLVRDDVARELTYTGRVVLAEEAMALGLATRVCADPLAEAHAMAQGIAQRSPNAVRAAKRLLNQANRVLDESAAALLLAESEEQNKLLGSAQQVETVKANLEKRLPVYP